MAYVSEYDYLFKLVMIGDSGVGKTSLYEGYSCDQYPPPAKFETFLLKYVLC